MRTIFAPNYTKIFMGKFEKTYIYIHINSFQTFTVDLLIIYTLLYKQHFYKQLQAETGKKSSKR